MKTRSAEELLGSIQADLARRKKEISSLHIHIAALRDQGGELVPSLRRAAVVMLYSHWEGFAKSSIEGYIAYVQNRGCPASELSDGLRALALLRTMPNARKDATLADIVRCLNIIESCDPVSSLAIDHLTNSMGNLTPDRAAHLLSFVALDFSSAWGTKKKALDSLIGSRHKISHGKLDAVASEDYLRAKDLVIDLLDWILDELTRLVSTDSHLLRSR